MIKSKYPQVELMRKTLELYHTYFQRVLGIESELCLTDLSVKYGRKKLVKYTEKGLELSVDGLDINKTQLKQLNDLKSFITPMAKSYIKRVK